jgi:hypothetical protein
VGGREEYHDLVSPTVSDLSGDGRPDLVLAHTRGVDDTKPDAPLWTGRYVQILVNGGDQSQFLAPKSEAGNLNQSIAHDLRLVDLDDDGVSDLFFGQMKGLGSNMHRVALLTVGLVLASCDDSGPKSTKTDSSKFATLAERQAFVERYVTFRRTYESLDFWIFFANGGGLGPSEWDTRLVAVVPAEQLAQWTVGLSPAAAPPDRQWLADVPTSLDLSGMTEWHVDARRTVGIDRARRIVVYRNAAN